MDWLEVTKLISIPVIASLVGWSTNWLAIKLTFYPINFIGIKPVFGWQGIIPSKAPKMASICVDSILSKIGTITEVVEQMDPKAIGRHILDTLEPRIEELVDDIMIRRHPTLWKNLPKTVKNLVYQRIKAELPNTIDALVDEMAPKIETLFDLKQMIVGRLENERTLLNRIFLECGLNEFKFIIKSGLWFGFLFGIPQLILWHFFPVPWVLPVCGFIVGWVTNWVALNVIFRPVDPKTILGMTFHGLFLKRQEEVSETFCEIITEEVLTVEQICHTMLTGPHADRTRGIIQRHFENLVDEAAGIIKPFTQVALGPEKFAELKTETGLKAIDISNETLSDPLFNHERAILVKEIMSSRMKKLPSNEFQDLLRPCFQEDELKLIIIGGLLGAAAGLLQLVYVFGGSLV